MGFCPGADSRGCALRGLCSCPHRESPGCPPTTDHWSGWQGRGVRASSVTLGSPESRLRGGGQASWHSGVAGLGPTALEWVLGAGQPGAPQTLVPGGHSGGTTSPGLAPPMPGAARPQWGDLCRTGGGQAPRTGAGLSEAGPACRGHSAKEPWISHSLRYR